MANTSAWLDDVEARRLPPVCVGTGAPAETTARFYLGGSLPMVLVYGALVKVGSLALLVCVMAFAFGGVGGGGGGSWSPIGSPFRPHASLPVSKAWRDRLRLFSELALGSWAIALALLVVAVNVPWTRAAAYPLVVAAALLGFALAVARETMQPHGQAAKASDGRRFVRLRNVHQGFAGAVDSVYSAVG